MAQPRRNGLDRDTGSKQSGRCEVTQIVKTDVRDFEAVTDSPKSKCYTIRSPGCGAIGGVRKDKRLGRQFDTELLRSRHMPVTVSYEAGESCGV